MEFLLFYSPLSQAAKTLSEIKISKIGKISDEERNKIESDIKKQYKIKSDIKYAAARMWVDEVINPSDTRYTIIRSLEIINNSSKIKEANFGILQV